MRIALFGGSFDPPHRGHIAIARAAADHFSLDRVLFAPCGVQPLKSDALVAPFADRLAMVELAVRADSRFVASSLDAPRADGQPNYTVDTLTALDESRDPADELFCITGADAFLELSRWRQPERLLELARWIVVSRPGFSLDSLARLANLPPQFARVLLLPGVEVNVSATEVRRALASRQPSAELDFAVANYIRDHKIYV